MDKLKIAREWCTRKDEGSYRRGDLTMERWYSYAYSKCDDVEMFPMADDNPEDTDILMACGSAYTNENSARAYLDWLDSHPNAKMIVLEGGRGPRYNFTNEVCMEALNRTAGFLHNSTFYKHDGDKLKKALEGKTFEGVNLNIFEPREVGFLPLSERNNNVLCFGAIMRAKGVYGFVEDFGKYRNGTYNYGTVGHFHPIDNPRGDVIRLPRFEPKVELEMTPDHFNMIDGYDSEDENFQEFFRHTRFAVFCHGMDPYYPKEAWIEAPEYCLLEAIDAGIPIIVSEKWLDSIRVFGEKPDVENSGILTYSDFGDLNENRLRAWEREYSSIVKRQHDFLVKWWGCGVERKLTKKLREIVGK